MKDSGASVFPVQRHVRVAIRGGMSKVTVLHEVTGVLKELARPWDQTPQEEDGQKHHDDTSHVLAIVGAARGSVNRRGPSRPTASPRKFATSNPRPNGMDGGFRKERSSGHERSPTFSRLVQLMVG